MIKLLSLFSGIGAFEAALRRGGYQFETVNYCEIDPYASKAYSQIHGISEDYNLKDVRQVNTLLMDNINLMTWGWPCQDISVAGKQRGFKDNDGNLTRSGLFFQGLRILTELQPEYAIAENVKALTGKKFTAEFETVLTSLDKAGYNNYWKVLNAKDYGIPQNRERVFIISIRKDIDTGTFTFPEKQQLTLRVKDLLEPVVDEKYYIDNERSRNLIRQILAKTDTNLQETDIKVNNIGTYNNHQSGIVTDPKGLSRCLTAVDYKDPVKIVETRTMIEITEPVICASRGRNTDNPSDRTTGIPTEQRLELKNDGCSNTLTTVQKDNMVLEPKIKRLGNLYDENAGGARAGNVYAPDGLAPALQTAQGGNRQPLIVIGSTQKHASVNTDGTAPCLTAMMGLGGGNVPMITEPQILKYERTEYGKQIRNQYEKGEINERRSNMRQYTTRKDGMSNTLTTVQKDNYVLDLYRIRKLTPRECFRLMGFTDEDFDKIKGISNTQLYKMAGNSIVVNVLEAIFKQLFKENHKE